MTVTPYSIAERFVGSKEVAGSVDNPMIVAMLRLDNSWPGHDEVPWCSAFVNYVAWLLRLPRSKSLAARSWLTVGVPIDVLEAVVGYDVVVLNRAGGPQDPDVLAAPGHVGFFAGHDRMEKKITVLGGNQSNSVSLQRFDQSMLLGVRRLA